MKTIDIVHRIQKGDRKAERLLFDALAPRLFGLCRRYAKGEPEAKDYLQESFIRVFDKIEQFKGEGSNHFESWFFKVSVNTILSIKRKDKRNSFIQLSETVPDRVEESFEMDRLSDEQLVSCIRRLPDGYRNVLNLYVFEKLSHKEIGLLLGITESTSRSQYLRAKKQLKEILIDRIPDLYEKKLV